MRRRRRDERGAAAVEAALVTPVIVMLVLGMLEFSFVLRDNAVVSSDTRIGARIAAAGAGSGPGTCDLNIAGCNPTAVPALAEAAADAIQRSGSAMPVDNIDYVIVYKANDAGLPQGRTAMPWTTKANAATACAGIDSCVVFSWNATQNRFRFVGGAWSSKTISACFPGTPDFPLDRVGVALQATHKMLTGMFGRSFTLRDYSVQNFEPLSTASCNSKSASPHQ